jgi:stage II sporulation protein D
MRRAENAVPWRVFVRGRAVIAAVVSGLAGVAPAAAATELVVTGKGWGHGVGMSQWGAYGYAQHGWSWKRILAHYYSGTQVAAAPVSRVRVLLGAAQPSVSIACAGAIRVSDRSGRSYGLGPGVYAFGRGLKLPVGHKRREVSGGQQHRERFTVVTTRRALRSPLVFDCPSAPLAWDGHAYHGLLVVRRAGKTLSVVNSVRLDDYVRGVVGGEMPHRWSIAALEAQAVAARSYALATLKPGKKFDLFSDTRSQVYGGIAFETPKTNLAVSRTAGQVVMWHGRVATAFFFSTSGGRTADVRDVWPTLGDVPYLRSVTDPYDSRSPHHAWGPLTFDATRLAKRLHVPAGAVTVERTPAGRVAAVQIGSQRIGGNTFRSELGLASTWFQVGSLSLTHERRQIVYGGKVGLDVRAGGLGRARLQRRVGAGAWKTLKLVGGPEHVTVEPQGQTLYRLSAGGVTGPVVSVAVAPRLRVTAAGAQLLTGAVAPLSRGSVTVWRRTSAGWKVVAHPQIDPTGRFSAPLRLRTGSYRIAVAADGRFAAATTSVHVTARLLASLSH